MCNLAAMSVGERSAPKRNETIAARSSAFNSEPFAMLKDTARYMQHAAVVIDSPDAGKGTNGIRFEG